MSVIDRTLSDTNIRRFLVDFKNLVNIVNNSQGELDIAIRDEYLNVYYKGNSLAKISFKTDGRYQVEIHMKFFEDTDADDPVFYAEKTLGKDYAYLTLDSDKPPKRFLQKRHINQFCSRIKKVNYGEEIVFEQALITDNLGRDDIIIIDRQIRDTALTRRLDLLALKQVTSHSNQYCFQVLEVKLGNNRELEKDVAIQLGTYVKHIESHFDDYKVCYEKQFQQKRELGLLDTPDLSSIDILKPVEGIVVVGGYSKLASRRIAILESSFPELLIKKFEYKL